MSRLIHRPNQAVDYGTIETNGSGNVLGDNNDSTQKQYYEDSGSIMLYPAFDGSLVPDGREIIAARVGHRQKNGGLLFLHNGWVMSYLRINSNRVAKSKAYKQDGYNLGARAVEGPAIYNAALAPWEVADVQKMTTDLGAATGEFGPDKNKKWCIGSESYIILVLDDPVPVPTINYPAAGATIATSSVDFKGTIPAPQSEQPVGCIFQVSRVNTFNDDTVQTFIGGLNQDTTAGTTSNYNSVVGQDSYTNLGPGVWYIRVKGRDYRGEESVWGATTSFTITHSALPVPTLTNPGSGTTKATPYGYREGSIATVPSGERYVGIQFQFCQNADFTTGPVISWTNNQMGRYSAGPVGYTADPNPLTEPGKNGNTVSTDDPDQYLVQGTWRGRVRCVDVWGQVGAWSSAVTFTVSHPPVVNDVWPSGGKAFDDDAFPVRWQFGDPWVGDAQSAFQVIIRDPSMNIIHNTGKVTSPFNNTDVSIPDIWKEQILNLSIQLWDKDDVASTVWTGTFKHSTAPVITLPYPAPDEVIITGQPALDWSVVFAPGATQKSYHIAFIRRDTGVIQYKTAIVASAISDWTPPSVVIKNVSDYQLALTITDTNDLYTTLLRNFSTDYVRPPSLQCQAFAETFEEDGYVTVLWPDTTVDPLFVEYRIYRKNEDIEGSGWEQVGTVTNPNQFEFHDWSTSGPYRYRYSITQVVILYGALVESLQDPYGDIIQVQSGHYWLIIENNEDLNSKLYNVVDDSYTEKIEMAEYVIIDGGGTRVTYGAPVGKKGSLAAQIRGGSPLTARQARIRIRRIQFEKTWCYLRDPFGNFTKIAIGEITVKRIPGVGLAEFVDIEIPYTEVGAPKLEEM